ncbi:multidrug resistance-associated protein 1 [Striga asiatica]|uniref:Multidrug resistance-associated protein 1 n=1 Tax=Striga asiatica TaxID=4170 RepID=A0A5A7PRQ1_STRAF|nr:multidrug resistance-associated protein 1 [Striga asiatica]
MTRRVRPHVLVHVTTFLFVLVVSFLDRDGVAFRPHPRCLITAARGLGGRLGRWGVEVPSAHGARAVVPEPEVHALFMEHVIARGQQPEDVIALKLNEAYGTLEPVLFLSEALDGRVGEGGERADKNRVEACSGCIRGGRGSGTRAIPCGAAMEARARAEKVATEIDGEENQEEDKE